jgi:hypothetical protein
LIEAQALGLKYLVIRDRRTGKFIRVPESMAKAKLRSNEELIEVWEKDPSTAAFTDLMNRALDKPATPPQDVDVNVGGDWDTLAARLASIRQERPRLVPRPEPERRDAD